MSKSETTAVLTWNRYETYASELEKGEFCYRRDDDGRVKWVHFWPYDSPCALSAAIAPQRLIPIRAGWGMGRYRLARPGETAPAELPKGWAE